MRSISQEMNKLVRGDFLSFKIIYFSLEKEVALNLLRDVYDYINNRYGDESFLHWDKEHRRERVVKSREDINFDKDYPYYHMSIGLKGDVITDKIYNYKTFKIYDKKIQKLDLFQIGKYELGFSADYKSYIRWHFFGMTNKNLKKDTLRLLSKEDVYPITKARFHDFEGIFSISTQNPNASLFMGELEFKCPTYCFEDTLDDEALDLYDFITKLSETYTNLNANVGITTEDGFPEYWYHLINYLDKPDWLFSKDEHNRFVLNAYRARQMFMCNVSWANIISPTISTCFPVIDSDECVEVKQMCNNALSVKMKKLISKTTINDLKKVRKVMYPTLMRGYSMYYLDDLTLRRLWDIEPVLDDEVTVNNNTIILKYNGEVDVEFLENNTMSKSFQMF